jgi:predicted DCC family thiol-disulfide oxidoreductase YuxK
MLDKADKSKIKDMDSVLLFEEGKIYYKSTAALKIAKDLPGLWKLFYALIIIPVPLRDIIYDYIAKNRYKWFGKKEECMIPTEEIKELFLDW